MSVLVLRSDVTCRDMAAHLEQPPAGLQAMLTWIIPLLCMGLFSRFWSGVAGPKLARNVFAVHVARLVAYWLN
jgi:hypothetical protein